MQYYPCYLIRHISLVLHFDTATRWSAWKINVLAERLQLHVGALNRSMVGSSIQRTQNRTGFQLLWPRLWRLAHPLRIDMMRKPRRPE